MPLWVINEAKLDRRYGVDINSIYVPGGARLTQSLIAGDVDVVFAGVTALTRARVHGADVAILGAAANLSSQKLMVGRNSKIRRVEDLKGAIIGVSQYGSEADTFTRNALAMAALKPDKDVTILQLGGHPQVAAAMIAGKLDVGALAGLPALTVERSGGRLLTSAVELKILSPSGTFATTRGYIQRKRTVVERLKFMLPPDGRKLDCNDVEPLSIDQMIPLPTLVQEKSPKKTSPLMLTVPATGLRQARMAKFPKPNAWPPWGAISSRCWVVKSRTSGVKPVVASPLSHCWLIASTTE